MLTNHKWLKAIHNIRYLLVTNLCAQKENEDGKDGRDKDGRVKMFQKQMFKKMFENKVTNVWKLVALDFFKVRMIE